MKKIHIILLAVGAGIIAILFLFQPKMIYSKPPVETTGEFTVTIKEDISPNNQTDQFDLETPSLNEQIANPNVTINWIENGSKKQAEPIK